MSVDGVGAAVAPARARRRRRRRAGLGLTWVRDRLATTPGRLALISALVVVGAAVFGVVATRAQQSRERAARAAGTQTEPLLVQAANLYTSLSDANATVATGLLAGGLEPPAKRARYLHDLRVATQALSALTEETGTAARAHGALATVANQLPGYSGLVESARVDNRLGYPLGAAYLRQAATLMTSTLLPAADQLYRIEAGRLQDDYRTGMGTSTIVAFIAASAAALLLLLLAQVYVARISRRILNLPMVLATVAVAAISAWGIVGLVREQNALSAAQQRGSDAVEASSAVTVLLSRAQGDLSLTLVNRGTDVIDPLDFAAVSHVLGRRGGLIAELSALARRSGSAAAAGRFDAEYAAYQAKAHQIAGLEGGGRLAAAIALAPVASAISEQANHTLAVQIAAAQNRFTTSATDATSAIAGLSLAIPLVTVLAAALALLGLQQRIGEYR